MEGVPLVARYQVRGLRQQQSFRFEECLVDTDGAEVEERTWNDTAMCYED